jgi:Leucine-rich repeat (LRR) protein
VGNLTQLSLEDNDIASLAGRGLQSSTFQLNVSALCGVHSGVVFGVVQEIFGGFGECVGCILCQKRLRLSCKVDECKPLLAGLAGLNSLMELYIGNNNIAELREAGAYPRPRIKST